ncbi:hypothetical protein P7K49_019785 [Saguinus oedipus]|uniref:Uncharacterized protein n=1 Tax=Saguinus oedipus TaxID=9490 RepID=A0ABQ9UYG7_SAGOE|nr:hypothetical protein P7K49_019785 [Saguinus oedipus]
MSHRGAAAAGAALGSWLPWERSGPANPRPPPGPSALPRPAAPRGLPGSQGTSLPRETPDEGTQPDAMGNRASQPLSPGPLPATPTCGLGAPSLWFLLAPL